MNFKKNRIFLKNQDFYHTKKAPEGNSVKNCPPGLNTHNYIFLTNLFRSPVYCTGQNKPLYLFPEIFMAP